MDIRRREFMEIRNVKKIIINAIMTTQPTWRTWNVHWDDIDQVFLARAYDQMGFDDWMFVNFLEDNNIFSIESIGRILKTVDFENKYDREIAGSLDATLYQDMKNGVCGAEGTMFYKSVSEFDGRKGAIFWKLLWYMLVCCNYLKLNYKSSFAYYLKNKYAEYENIEEISDDDFLSMSQEQWDSFKKNKNPWNELLGVGLNVFDYIVGDLVELEFVKNSYKLDSANQRFLTVTGIFQCRPEELDHQEVVDFLLKLNLPYNLREINKGLYAYCSELGCDKYCFCRKPEKCLECNVNKICKQDFDKLKKENQPMKLIAHKFAEQFKHWKITLPDEDLRRKKSGFIQKAGWLIQYCFGEDETGEYLDYYAAHRMTDDRHIRIYSNGNKKSLPAISSMRLVKKDPIEDKRLKDEYYEHNRKVVEILAEKGFSKFTINMYLHTGMGKKGDK